MPAPSTFTPERAVDLLSRLAGGRSLWSICRDADMPSENTVLRWARQDEVFAAHLDAVRVRGKRGRLRTGDRITPVYSDALAQAICAALAEGFSLRDICAAATPPVHPNTVMRWTHTKPGFAAAYAEATRPRETRTGLRIGRGRSGAYTAERAQAIIDRMLEGRALSHIVRDPDMPSWPVIKQWRRRHMDFHLALQAARRFQLDILFDEVLAAAEDGHTAAPARWIISGLLARGTLPLAAGRGDGALAEGVVRPVKARAGPPTGAPGIGHNSRGRFGRV